MLVFYAQQQQNAPLKQCFENLVFTKCVLKMLQFPGSKFKKFSGGHALEPPRILVLKRAPPHTIFHEVSATGRSLCLNYVKTIKNISRRYNSHLTFRSIQWRSQPRSQGLSFCHPGYEVVAKLAMATGHATCMLINLHLNTVGL